MAKIGFKAGLGDKSVIVQGLGNVGYHSAKFLAEFGATIVGLCEYEGAIYNANGLNVDEVFAHRKNTGSILGFPGATDFKNSYGRFGAAIVIFLVPAALENQITVAQHQKHKSKNHC